MKLKNNNQTVTTAVIMAAGMGTRFGEMTETKPKGFIPFKGIPMVVRSVETLISCGIKRIIIGTGYHHDFYDALSKIFPQVECVFSPRYRTTNSMYTLWNCREAIGSDNFLLLESDLVFESKAITSLLEHPYNSVMLITPVKKFQDQYYVQIDLNDELVNCSTDRDAIQPSGELVGIHKIDNNYYKMLCDGYEKIVKKQPKLGYEFMLLKLSRDFPLKVIKVNKLEWYEIDDEKDLAYAEENVKID